jgi:hypothetical protein
MNIEQIVKTEASDNNNLSLRDISEFNEYAEYDKHETDIIKPDIVFIEKTSLVALIEQNRSLEMKSLVNTDNREASENSHAGLTEDEKSKVKEEHPDWTDEIIDAIGSWEEYEIYNKANLKLEYINGKPCLIRSDIDMEKTDIKGRTNRERMEDGLAPLDKNGKPIELHHIGQKKDSPLAELTFNEHHCGGNDIVLHDKKKESEVHGEGNTWGSEKERHWESRSQTN